MNVSLKDTCRGLAKAGCATGMHWSSLDKFIGVRRGLKDAPLVVGYHRVVKNFGKSDPLSISPMLVSAPTFEQHLDWIGKHYRFVSLDELALVLEEKKQSGKNREETKKSGKPVAAITFDDGYQDVYHNAFPILQRKGIPAAVFVVTDLVSTSRLLAHDELYLLFSAMLERGKLSQVDNWREVAVTLHISSERRGRLISRLNDVNNPFQATRVVLETLHQADIHNFVRDLRQGIFIAEDKLEDFKMLNWNMLREMVAQGVIVGSHTKSHALLAHETPAVVAEEVEGSRQELEQRLGVPIKHFAYPDGRFNAVATQAVAAAGYRAAYTICGHRDPRYPLLTVSRRMLWENTCMDGFGRFSPAILSCQVNGIFDPADRCRLRH